VDGIRDRCGDDFMIGVRLSPERFGMKLPEVVQTAERLMHDDRIEFLDMSMWDVFKMPEDDDMQGKNLLTCFTELDRNNVRLGVAGKLRNPDQMTRAMDEGVDWVMLGRAGILHHDYPNQLKSNHGFEPVEVPVSPEHLLSEGLSPTFVEYMKNWKGFVRGNDGVVDMDVILNS
jgi:2,4-dienoyl-CoA reductase-like NADH-dependent reductase (Old Yellow Enzyme family)